MATQFRDKTVNTGLSAFDHRNLYFIEPLESVDGGRNQPASYENADDEITEAAEIPIHVVDERPETAVKAKLAPELPQCDAAASDVKRKRDSLSHRFKLKEAFLSSKG
jgi:RNase H-fold protein (predicted Holliday junction resolvase)